MYSEQQLEQYLQHINYHSRAPRDSSLDYLAGLMRHHVARIPFENITLHYSRHRLLSLDLQDLFEKFVVNSRGGYCMEQNAFFREMLIALGFTVFSGGARVFFQADQSFGGWSHMMNLVDIDGKRYLVDVGFGSEDPVVPIPLEHDVEVPLILPHRGRLQYKNLPKSLDPKQRSWVYAIQESPDAPWNERYAFTELEFTPADFEVMNLSTMTSRKSFFTQVPLAARMLLSEDTSTVTGLFTLYDNRVKKRVGQETVVAEQLSSEEQRVQALEKYFDIKVSPVEQAAIKGTAAQIKG